MSTRIEDVNDPVVTLTTPEELAEDQNYEYFEEDANQPILTLAYDELVVITGDLQKFARDVVDAVFGPDARIDY